MPRFRVIPGDVPADAAARRLGLTLREFEELLPRLISRGFPQADIDTGRYDLDAIDAWRRRRHRHLFPDSGAGLTNRSPQPDADAEVRARLREAFGGG